MISITLAVGCAYPSVTLAQEDGAAGPALVDAAAQGAAHAAPSGAPPGPTDPQPTAQPEGDSSASRNAEYDALVLRALEAFGASEWRRARRLFEQAHGIEPTARTLRTIGMCAFNQGDMVGALQNLEAALGDARKPLTEDQRTHVRELISRAGAKVGRVRLVLYPLNATIQVDGKPPAMLSEDEIVLEPGRHEIVIFAEGYGARTQHLRVAAHDRATLELRLEPGEDDSDGAGRARHAELLPLPSPRAGEAEAVDAGGGATRTWGWLALSVGIAGTLAGGTTAALALSQKSELDDACIDRACGPEDHDRVDDYETLRTLTIIGGAIGVAGLATGTVLLFAADGEPERAARVDAVFGPGWVGVRGQL